MKYQAPYGSPGGPNDWTAVYINGNPATGTMGSIPPAASIENPQREIVNLITDTGFTPTDADLHQLGKGVQSGKLIYAIDFGIPNSYLINTVPALTAYAAGQHWNVWVKNTNTGASTLNINSIGPRSIVLRDGQALKGGEMTAGAVVALIDDGTHLQLQGVGSFGAFLTAAKDYYVNVATGDDTLYDGTTATVSAPHGPFKTIQRAITATLSWNMNGYGVTIHVAGGTYAPFICYPLNGAGSVLITGDKTTPANVLIQATTGEAIAIYASSYTITGMKATSGGNGVAPHQGNGLRVYGAVAQIGYMEFGACAHAQIMVQSTGALTLQGTVGGDNVAFINISGDTPVAHMLCAQNSFIFLGGSKMNLIGALNIGTFAAVQTNSVIDFSYSALTGSSTGTKYAASTNGVINTGSGINYFPGTVAGTMASGGQYT